LSVTCIAPVEKPTLGPASRDVVSYDAVTGSLCPKPRSIPQFPIKRLTAIFSQTTIKSTLLPICAFSTQTLKAQIGPKSL
jgi:hypothetical protein